MLYPALWSPETPHLYNAHFLVTEASDVIDSTTESFGIRTVTYSAEQGLFLNGKRIILMVDVYIMTTVVWGQRLMIVPKNGK